MARPAIPMIGAQFGQLTVEREAGRAHDGSIVYFCTCSCGNSLETSGVNLRRQEKTSCGCVKKSLHVAKVKGKRSRPELYSVWANMMNRCYSPSSEVFPRYGGRGIEVAAEWHNYKQFEKDMSPRPPGLTLERLNNNLGYCKQNCAWVSRKDQQDNRSTSIRFQYQGRLVTLRELSALCGVPYETLRSRLALYKWSIEDATRPEKYRQPPKLEKSVAIKLYDTTKGRIL